MWRSASGSSSFVMEDSRREDRGNTYHVRTSEEEIACDVEEQKIDSEGFHLEQSR